MKNKAIIGERPPLADEQREQIRDVMEFLNADALKEFTPHDVLKMLIDRGWSACFPEKVSKVKRKKYEKFIF